MSTLVAKQFGHIFAVFGATGVPHMQHRIMDCVAACGRRKADALSS